APLGAVVDRGWGGAEPARGGASLRAREPARVERRDRATQPRPARSAGARSRAGAGVPVAELAREAARPARSRGVEPMSRDELDQLARIARDAGRGIMRT